MSEEITKPTSHDTFVIGGKLGRIVFIKGYEYEKQKEEAQTDLEFVQNKDNFDFWYISHVGGWILKSKLDAGEEMPISIKM